MLLPLPAVSSPGHLHAVSVTRKFHTPIKGFTRRFHYTRIQSIYPLQRAVNFCRGVGFGVRRNRKFSAGRAVQSDLLVYDWNCCLPHPATSAALTALPQDHRNPGCNTRTSPVGPRQLWSSHGCHLLRLYGCHLFYVPRHAFLLHDEHRYGITGMEVCIQQYFNCLLCYKLLVNFLLPPRRCSLISVCLVCFFMVKELPKTL